MDSIVDLAPGAEDNDVAARFAELIRQNLRVKPHKIRDFRALRGAVMLVAQDVWSAATLRFYHGRLTVHDGSIGIPSVTFCGDATALLGLSDVPLTPLFRLPLALPLRDEGSATFRRLMSLMRHGELTIYGLLAHPRLVTRFLRVVSVHG